MLIEMTASVLISFNAFSSPGASAEAQFVAEKASQAKRYLCDSTALGLQKQQSFDQLYTVAEQCSAPNWDGYNAAPVSNEAYRLAYCFIEQLPPNLPMPTIGAEPDGHLTLEWHRSADNTLSISVAPDGNLHYSALLGPNSVYGTEAFFDQVPEIIVRLVHRLPSA